MREVDKIRDVSTLSRSCQVIVMEDSRQIIRWSQLRGLKREDSSASMLGCRVGCVAFICTRKTVLQNE